MRVANSKPTYTELVAMYFRARAQVLSSQSSGSVEYDLLLLVRKCQEWDAHFSNQLGLNDYDFYQEILRNGADRCNDNPNEESH